MESAANSVPVTPKISLSSGLYSLVKMYFILWIYSVICTILVKVTYCIGLQCPVGVEGEGGWESRQAYQNFLGAHFKLPDLLPRFWQTFSHPTSTLLPQRRVASKKVLLRHFNTSAFVSLLPSAFPMPFLYFSFSTTNLVRVQT